MRVTTRDLRLMKRRGERIPMLTAYDYTSARLVEAAGVPVILVGDSLGQWLLGYETTLPVTMDDMIHHVKAVIRGTEKAHVVADMPFMSYQADAAEAVRNAGRMLQEGGAQSVKLEGGAAVAPTVRKLVDAGIPVMGHVGFTPQSFNQLGGFRVQGKLPREAAALIEDAAALEEAGCHSMVVEMVPAQLAALITDRLSVPTIGIGSGVHCDGQVQVFHDMLRAGRRLRSQARARVRRLGGDDQGRRLRVRRRREGLELPVRRGEPRDEAGGAGEAQGPAGGDRVLRMKTVETVAELRAELARAARPLGLVPTMGALHDGHMALVDRARLDNRTVCATHLRQPRPVRPARGFFGLPARYGGRSWEAGAGRDRRRLRAVAAGDVPGRFRHVRRRWRRRRPARGRAPPRPLPRRRDRRVQAARRRAPRPGLLRTEGRPAVRCGEAPQRRPRPRRRDRRSAHRPGAGRARPEQPQRVPVSVRAPCGNGRLPRPGACPVGVRRRRGRRRVDQARGAVAHRRRAAGARGLRQRGGPRHARRAGRT